MRQSRSPMAGKRGFALLIVVVVLLLVSFLASQLIMQVRTELQMTSNRRERTLGRFLAEGGVSLAIFRLIDEPAGTSPPEFGLSFLLGWPYETVLPKGKMEYYMVNESGKINLNSESMELLEKLLVHLGLDDNQVSIISDSILDWRDGDDLYRINGAEQEYYEEQGLSYGPRNGRIEDPAEFFMIRGTEVLRDRIDPYEYFTALSGQKQININSLTPGMLKFLAGGDPEIIGDYHATREAVINLDASHVTMIFGPTRGDELSKYFIYNDARNPYFTIIATGYPGAKAEEDETDPDGETVKLHGTRIQVRLGRLGNTMQYLSWKESLI